VPFITAVNGVAAGGGCGYALAGDIVIAGRSAYFLQPFANIRRDLVRRIVHSAWGRGPGGRLSPFSSIFDRLFPGEHGLSFF